MNRRRGRNICLLSTAALLVGLAAAPAQAQSQGVETLLQQARYWLEHDRPDRADEAYRRVLAIDPDNAEARRGLRSGGSPAPPSRATPSAGGEPARQSRPGATRPPAPAPARAPAQPVVRWTAADERAEGFRALDRGDLAAAARRFQAALARTPADDEALGGLGVVRLRQDRFIEARDLLSRASRLGNAEQWAQALQTASFYGGLEEARSALNGGRVERAQEIAETLVRSGFEDSEPALELLAEIYEKQGRFADAADILQQASAGDGQSQARLQSRAARNRALEAARSGSDLEAENQFVAGLMLDPEDPWIRYEFARYLSRKGRVAEVESMLSAIAAIGTAESYYAAALLSDQLGDARQAQTFLDQIPDAKRTALVKRLASDLQVKRQVARSRELGAAGQTATAVAQLRQIAQSDGVSANGKAEVASALLALDDPEGAALAARDAMTNGGITSADAYEPIIRVLARAGQEADARLALENARALTASSIEGQTTIDRLSAILAAARADRLRLDGQYADAFDVLRQAWNIALGNRDLLLELALLYESGGLPDRAAQTFQLYLAQDPQNRDAMLGLTRSAAAAGDRQLADAAFARLLAAAPNDYEVYLAGADLAHARGNEGEALKYLKKARELYARQTGLAQADLTSSNPFGVASASGNPFRNASPAPASVDPFALPAGARLQAANAPLFSPVTRANSGGGLDRSPLPPSSPREGRSGGYWADGESATQSASGGDAVLAQIDDRLAALATDRGTRFAVTPSYRGRSGEEGLSALRAIDSRAGFTTSLGNGELSAGADIVMVDAGQTTRSALARFGRNATLEAQAIVDKQPSPLVAADTQHDSGVAPYVEYEDRTVRVKAGTTPVGFGGTDLIFEAQSTLRPTASTVARAWFRHTPVDDSVLSYAGTRDPVSGEFWGRVMRTGGGLGLSFDRDGTGFYADAAYFIYRGNGVLDNNSVEANVGGYLPVLAEGPLSITAGINLNYQTYDNNQNFFTFGHGGYFSPQSFLSVGFPFNFKYALDRLDLEVQATPGYQSYGQDRVDLYPLDPAAQGALDALKAQNSDVRSYYDAISKTGMAFAGKIQADFRVSARTTLGARIAYDTFGVYKQFTSSLSVNQRFGRSEPKD